MSEPDPRSDLERWYDEHSAPWSTVDMLKMDKLIEILKKERDALLADYKYLLERVGTASIPPPIIFKTNDPKLP